MKKTKRIFAIISIICLLALYISALCFAMIDTEAAFLYFKCAIGATIILPIILYAMTIVYKMGHPQDSFDSSDDEINQ